MEPAKSAIEPVGRLANGLLPSSVIPLLRNCYCGY
jgi:hypothetical protein